MPQNRRIWPPEAGGSPAWSLAPNRSGRSFSGTPVPLRNNRWPRPSRERSDLYSGRRSHADPRTTMRSGPREPAPHATYIVAAYVAGAARKKTPTGTVPPGSHSCRIHAVVKQVRCEFPRGKCGAERVNTCLVRSEQIRGQASEDPHTSVARDDPAGRARSDDPAVRAFGGVPPGGPWSPPRRPRSPRRGARGQEGGDDDGHTTDLPMADIVDVLLAINVGAYLF